jgi:iron complex transport system ATP-binding protein
LAGRFSDRMLMLKQGSIFAFGTPDAVLTEENVEAVYGIKAQVSNSVLGRPQVTPLISEFNGIKNVKTPQEIETKYG